MPSFQQKPLTVALLFGWFPDEVTKKAFIDSKFHFLFFLFCFLHVIFIPSERKFFLKELNRTFTVLRSTTKVFLINKHFLYQPTNKKL